MSPACINSSACYSVNVIYSAWLWDAWICRILVMMKLTNNKASRRDTYRNFHSVIIAGSNGNKSHALGLKLSLATCLKSR